MKLGKLNAEQRDKLVKDVRSAALDVNAHLDGSRAEGRRVVDTVGSATRLKQQTRCRRDRRMRIESRRKDPQRNLQTCKLGILH